MVLELGVQGPSVQAWGARESSRSAQSCGQDYTTQGIPDLKTGPNPPACYVAADSQPLQLRCPHSLHSKPHWSHSAAQMRQDPSLPPRLEPTDESSSPSSSHSCLLLNCKVSPSYHLLRELLPSLIILSCSLFSRQPKFNLSSATYWLCDLGQAT